MNIEGCSGICACCFHPITKGKEYQIRPGNHYVNLERSIYRLELEKEKKNEK